MGCLINSFVSSEESDYEMNPDIDEISINLLFGDRMGSPLPMGFSSNEEVMFWSDDDINFSDSEDLALSDNGVMDVFDSANSSVSMDYEQNEGYESDTDYGQGGISKSDMGYDADDEEESVVVEDRPFSPIDWRKVYAENVRNRQMDNCLTFLVMIEPGRRWCIRCLNKHEKEKYSLWECIRHNDDQIKCANKTIVSKKYMLCGACEVLRVAKHSAYHRDVNLVNPYAIYNDITTSLKLRHAFQLRYHLRFCYKHHNYEMYIRKHMKDVLDTELERIYTGKIDVFVALLFSRLLIGANIDHPFLIKEIVLYENFRKLRCSRDSEECPF